MFQFPLHRDPRCNYSIQDIQTVLRVSVPFTSGSSLQLKAGYSQRTARFMFQFPLHRDPRCNLGNSAKYIGSIVMFQFPLHRDPRCNFKRGDVDESSVCFSSLYIGILAATHSLGGEDREIYLFQFPLHRDPRCNFYCKIGNIPFQNCFSSLYIGILAAT